MASNINPDLKKLSRPLTFLKPDPENAREHSRENIDSIKFSLREFQQNKPIVAMQDGTVIAGNGTLIAAQELGWDEIAAVIFDDVSKARAYAIADNRTAELANWNEEALAKSLRSISDVGISLSDVGFDDDALKSVIVEPHLRTLLNLDVKDEKGDKYTDKIVSPVYEPKGQKPQVKSLVDTTKTDELLVEIEKAKLPNDVAAFLRHAAQRHTVFNFRRIADFYAHSEPEVQRLFENSALVIIDFNKAIENGFVALSEKIDAMIQKEHAAGGDEDEDDA